MEIMEFSKKLKDNIKLVIKGKDEIIDKVIICLLSSGHILLEDVPGTGKTTLVKALSKSMNLGFSRVQFTPDLLPSDLTGIHFFDQKDQQFVFRAGPVFTNILLADEINRATPRTQSSLLECMEEKQVSVDGETMPLSKTFFVAATQNPVEIQGTFPLPEAQLDRFFMRLYMGYPDKNSEKEMLTSQETAHPIDSLTAVVTEEDILSVQQKVKEITVSDEIKNYILDIVAATRTDSKIRLGVSPRGALALMRASQAQAAVNGRSYVIPDDVKAVCYDVMAHRIIIKAANHMQSSGASEAIRTILAQIPVPAVK